MIDAMAVKVRPEMSIEALMKQERSVVERERYERGVETIRRLCQRVGRILTADPMINVHSHYGPAQAPAWIAGRDITFAHDVITGMVEGDMTDRAKITICLLFHELGHYRFDPKPDNAIWRAERQALKNAPLRAGQPAWAAVSRMLNVLNDQRHEIMTAGVYPVARDYFRDATLRGMQMVIKITGGIPAENYLLYYGRRHVLPAAIIARVREAMVAAHGEQKTAKAEALINEYLPLTLSNDDVLRMMQIATELSLMFPAPKNDDCLGIGKTGQGSNAATSKKASERVKQQLAKADKGEQGKAREPQDIDEERDAGALGAEKDDKPQNDKAKGQKPSKSEQGADEADEGDDAEGDDAEGDDAEGDDAEGDDAGDEGEGKGNDSEDDAQDGAEGNEGDGDQGEGDQADDTDASSTESSHGAGGEAPEDKRTLDEMVDDERVEAGNALERDVMPYIDALRAALDDEAVKDGDLSEHIKTQADRITRMFEKINVDLDLTEVYGLKSGRLDMRRVVPAMASGSDRIFRKRQEELTDEAKMGVFIAIDASGSMAHRLKTATEAGLTIGRGAEKAGHMVKIISFDSGNPYNVVKSWFGKQYAQASISGGGGTPFSPFLQRVNAELDALHGAERIRHSVIFICTDGGHDEGEEIVRRLMRVSKDKHATHIYWIGIGTKPKQYREVERVIVVKTVNDLQHAMQGVLRDLAGHIRDDVKEGR